MSDEPNPRLERFAAELDELTSGPRLLSRERLGQRLGALGMIVGIAIAFLAYGAASTQDSGDLAADNLEHNELLILAVSGAALAVVGAIVWLRYSLGRLLRLWLLRQLEALRRET